MAEGHWPLPRWGGYQPQHTSRRRAFRSPPEHSDWLTRDLASTSCPSPCAVLLALSRLGTAAEPATYFHSAVCFWLPPRSRARPHGGLLTCFLKTGNHTEPARHLYSFSVTAFRVLLTTHRSDGSHSPPASPIARLPLTSRRPASHCLSAR